MNIVIIPVGVLGTNCYLLISKEKSCAIIDPGARPDKIEQVIEKEGLTPKYILLTHGHFDHIDAVKPLTSKYEGLELYIGKGDLELVTVGLAPESFHAETPGEYIVEKAKTIDGGQELELDELIIRTLETPGHSAGGITYICQDALFCGDTLFRGSAGRTDLHGGDYSVLLKSLRKLAELDGDYSVYPGHGESSRLEHERRTNPYMCESLE